MISTIIVCVMTCFMAFGAIDKALLNDRLGYGPQFEAGLHTMGPLSVSMVGIMCLAPVLGRVMTPIVSPLYRLVGADPAMLAGTILAVEAFGRGFEEKGCTLEVLGLNVVGHFDFEFEVTASEAVDLVATHGVGGVVGPL